MADLPNNNQELRRRIGERRAALERTRQRLCAHASTFGREQYHAVEEAIVVVDTHLRGGWELVDEVAAAELSGWLDSTETLARPLPGAN